MKIILFADFPLIETITCNVLGLSDNISPKVEVQSINRELGGFGQIVDILAKKGFELVIFSVVGKDIQGKHILDILDHYKDVKSYVFVDDDLGATESTMRFMTDSKQVILEVKQGRTKIISEEILSKLEEIISKELVAAEYILQGLETTVVSDVLKKFIDKQIRNNQKFKKIIKVDQYDKNQNILDLLKI